MPDKQTRFDNTPVKPEFHLPPAELPAEVNVLIVGGGIAGMSIAYHLAKAGWQDVCVIEQHQIGSGTTWHSAGQVGQLRGSSALTKINKASANLYATLNTEAGHDPGWLQCGGLQLARCRERMYQFERQSAMAQYFGIEANLLSAAECADYWPGLRTTDLIGGVHLPGDGRVLPGECTVALARAAINGGVQIVTGAIAHELIIQQRPRHLQRVVGVKTDRGSVRARWTVLATNMWMRQLGLAAGIDIPVYPCEHHYVVTQPLPHVTRDCPCTRDPDAGIYFRALDDGGVILGSFDPRAKPWSIGDQIPAGFPQFGLLESDWPEFERAFAQHCHRLPCLSRENVVKFVNGPEAFTPDNHFIMGQPYGTEGVFVCGGWNSAGIATAGGAGKYAVEWMENGGMTIDLMSVDIRRFLPFQNRRAYLQERVSEVLGLHYAMAWPGREMETARGARLTANHAHHRDNNACFGETAGWERPLYFAPAGVPPDVEYSFVRQNWHDWVAAEVNTCRNQLALLDQSTFGKFLVTGSDSLPFLQRLCGANIDQPAGTAIYTGMFNRRGTYESDLVVVRVDQDEFYLVTSTSQQTRDVDWISKHMDQRIDAKLTDITEQNQVLSIMGPESRELLSKLAETDFSDRAFPHGQSRMIDIEHIPLRAIRMSYVGELGWELHVDHSNAEHLYHSILRGGESFGIRSIGQYAINTMRIEKGFRAMGHELSPADTPLEAGLGFTIDWEKEFIGKSALLQQRERGLTRRLVQFALLDPDIILWGGEPIMWHEQAVGYTTSACHSPTLGTGIAMGYVSHPDGSLLEKGALQDGDFHIVQRGRRYAARASWNGFL